jgi:hypothetical protein
MVLTLRSIAVLTAMRLEAWRHARWPPPASRRVRANARSGKQRLFPVATVIGGKRAPPRA